MGDIRNSTVESQTKPTDPTVTEQVLTDEDRLDLKYVGSTEVDINQVIDHLIDLRAINHNLR